MNQEKIGKFICELRKEKKLTQKELADKLNITDRAVSKWENGRGLPDLSLLMPLCEELDISINELLSGERLNKKEYNQRLEENIVKTIEYSNLEIKDIKSKIKNILVVLCVIFGLILIDTFQAIIFKNSPIISWEEKLSDDDSYVDCICKLFYDYINRTDISKKFYIEAEDLLPPSMGCVGDMDLNLLPPTAKLICSNPLYMNILRLLLVTFKTQSTQKFDKFSETVRETLIKIFNKINNV
jgi:transcriptional regulator with XRE-family HTH domain